MRVVGVIAGVVTVQVVCFETELYAGLIFYLCVFLFFFFKQKTAYEIRNCDWSSDVCSSDLSLAFIRFCCVLVVIIASTTVFPYF